MHDSQSNKASLSFRVGRATTATDEVLKPLASRTNQATMELLLNDNAVRSLLVHLLSNSQDRSFGFGNSVFVTMKNNLRDVPVVCRLVDIDLSTGVLLDVLDGRTTLAEDAGNRAGGDGELDLDVVRLLDLVRLGNMSTSTVKESGY